MPHPTAVLELTDHPLPVTEDAYRTAPVRVSWLARRFPSLVFFARLTSIVIRAGLKAKWSTYDGQDWIRSSWEVTRALESVGVQIEVTGLHYVRDGEGPCLVVGNHMSTLETMVLPGLIQPLRQVTFVVKEQLIHYPIFKHVMRSRDPIAVSQTDPRGDLKRMLSGGLERLARGVSLIVFPQGERTQDFRPDEFNSIGVKLASRAEVPIVPLALRTDAWDLGAIISDFGRIDPRKKVHFAFGPPLTVEGRGTAENEKIIQFISTKLSAWKTNDEGRQSANNP
jgi:1-acyl-sn-glycerol-3-phosphate acyltransferase